MGVRLQRVNILSVFVLIAFLLIFPEVSKSGITKGLMISSNVIIPSLFPFMVCVSIIIKSGFSIKNKFLNGILYAVFGHSTDTFFVFLLSMLGGYPVGAKLIDDMYNKNAIDSKTADVMLTYCVNAGPAFIISVVGGALGSRIVGVFLLISHILSSVIIAIIFAPKIKKQTNCKITYDKKSIPIAQSFFQSVNETCESIIKICSFVVLFSSILSYFDYFFANMPIIKNISNCIEITTAVLNTKNIYIISFLLGFSGISIWCQIIALSKKRKINIPMFIFGRILHGSISCLITKAFFAIFEIKVPTFSNNIEFTTDFLYSNTALFLSLLLMLIVLLMFIYTKNNSGKFIRDVI